MKLARKAIAYFLHTGQFLEDSAPTEFSGERGVFVTLHKYPEKELRGCIGFPEAVKPLWNAVIEAAVSAAFRDPRFIPLKAEELEKILAEVSVLTVPEELRCGKEGLPEKIEIGRDGLIVRKAGVSGLLLPQVAPEWKWNSTEFLENACAKAGMEKSCWKEKETSVCRFQAQIFKEKEPEGKVEQESPGQE